MKQKQGQYQGFIDLIHEHQAILHRLCAVYTTKTQDKEDLYQEMLLQAWRSFTSYRRQSKFSTWLYRVALNTALIKRRMESRRRDLVSRLALTPDLAVEDEPHRETDIGLLYSCIQQLPDLNRAIVLLYLERYTYEEIAEIIGLTRSNVSVRLVRIKKQLRGLLIARGYEEGHKS